MRPRPKPNRLTPLERLGVAFVLLPYAAAIVLAVWAIVYHPL